MIKIHIFEPLKKKIDPITSFYGDMILKMPLQVGLTFRVIIEYLKITNEDYLDCFLNGAAMESSKNPLISDESRVAMFSEGLYLLCISQHLKSRGFTTKITLKDCDYFLM